MGAERVSTGLSGLVPASEGWSVVDVRDTEWRTHPAFGVACLFERPGAPFPDVGVTSASSSRGAELLLPLGDERRALPRPPRRVRADRQRRGAVVAGLGLLALPAEDRARVRRGGTGQSAILMNGGRSREYGGSYPVSEAALRHGAGVDQEVATSAEAYAGHPRRGAGRPDDWDLLPWA